MDKRDKPGRSAAMTEPWRQLRLGDRIRIVRMPYDAVTPGYVFMPETRRLFKKLMARGRSVLVFEAPPAWVQELRLEVPAAG